MRSYRGRGGGSQSRNFGRTNNSSGGRTNPNTFPNRTPSSDPSQIRGNLQELSQILIRLDGASYPRYKEILGCWKGSDYTLIVDYIQSDPYAPPSRVRVIIPHSTSQLNPDLFNAKARKIATCDFLTRQFADAIKLLSSKKYSSPRNQNWSAPKGGGISIEAPGQEILERSSVLIDSESGEIECRFTVSFPARGRTILGHDCAQIVCDTVSKIVSDSLIYANFDRKQCNDAMIHAKCAEDAEYLRNWLDSNCLLAFVANGAILPRASGSDERPMKSKNSPIIPFRSPKELQIDVKLPNSGVVSGAAIRQGVNLIVGGGFHGKSTLLSAIERGVYNHIPGDGRELVVTVEHAAKVRAEDGRSINGVDISTFINNLPFHKDTTSFCTQDASGSTSQAANIVETIQAGSKCLLMDEDTCATNFMIRDARMAALVSADKEPITPLVSRIQWLYQNRGVSSILVIGGCGEYFNVADCVIRMDEFCAFDATREAKHIVKQFESIEPLGNVDSERNVKPKLMETEDIQKTERFVVKLLDNFECKCSVRALDRIQFGEYELDLGAVEQLVDRSQTRAISDAILYLDRFIKTSVPSQTNQIAPNSSTTNHIASVTSYTNQFSMNQILDHFSTQLDSHGFDFLDSGSKKLGVYSKPRRLELAAAINRLRTVEAMTQKIDF
eukprot:CAMPEP_0182444312 /NCGR_PEP_ID=MMETSP1172-20130603/2808_1 /TAXON_ID=708627 /ORGANISM="Timspurckia oligopyrenoides, Strain CCMP3278" /LENGTH=669 /DNA_ID=CAMNT_0024639845 /DNA_START=69 /DNA_END=2078 /DNA_ORIENTATION=-